MKNIGSIILIFSLQMLLAFAVTQAQEKSTTKPLTNLKKIGSSIGGITSSYKRRSFRRHERRAWHSPPAYSSAQRARKRRYLPAKTTIGKRPVTTIVPTHSSVSIRVSGRFVGIHNQTGISFGFVDHNARTEIVLLPGEIRTLYIGNREYAAITIYGESGETSYQLPKGKIYKIHALGDQWVFSFAE